MSTHRERAALALPFDTLVVAADRATAARAEWLFVDVTDASGLAFVHFNGMSGELYSPEIMGSGVALFDYSQGLAELAPGRCAEATWLFDEALVSRPDSGEIAQAVARTEASCAGVEPARRARALDLDGQLIAAHRDAAHATTLAMAFAANGDFDLAVDLQEQLLAAAQAAGASARIDWHAGLLERYRGGRPADRAWPARDSVFHPEVGGAGPDRAGGR